MDLGSGFGIAARSICTATTPTASISAPRNQNAQFWDCYQSSQPGRKRRHHRAGRERGSVLALALGIHSCFMIAWLKSTVFDSWISSRYRTHPSEIHPALLQVPAHHLRRLIFFLSEHSARLRHQARPTFPQWQSHRRRLPRPQPPPRPPRPPHLRAPWLHRQQVPRCSPRQRSPAWCSSSEDLVQVTWRKGRTTSRPIQAHADSDTGKNDWKRQFYTRTPRFAPHAPVALITFSNMF